jgi:hypothetical protein
VPPKSLQGFGIEKGVGDDGLEERRSSPEFSGVASDSKNKCGSEYRMTRREEEGEPKGDHFLYF